MLLSTEQLWLIIGFSFIFLVGFVMAVICCICWLKIKKKNNQLYEVEERNVFYELSIHRQCNYVLYPEPEELNENHLNEDGNLIDSPSLSGGFKNSSLKIKLKTDELYPYSSTSSFRTYYSANSQESNSLRSFVTISEGSDVSETVWSSPIH